MVIDLPELIRLEQVRYFQDTGVAFSYVTVKE